MGELALATAVCVVVLSCALLGVIPGWAMAEQASESGSPAAAGLDASLAHTCAILPGGSVRCWGYGGDGELGYGNTDSVGATQTPASVGPVDLGPGLTATAISAGDYYTCAILNDGSVRCWGYNGNGELGYGNTSNVDSPAAAGPVDLGPGRTAVAISAGRAHTCVILDDGSVRCWGYGAYGQLGYGGTSSLGDTPASTPDKLRAVDLGGRRALAISAGGLHTCAILDDGSVRCWGDGANGQLGYGNTTNVSAPNGAASLTGVACPSLCIAVDRMGRRVTFDPTAPGAPTPVTIDGGHLLIAVACPVEGQCTTIDDDGQELTFDPSAPGYPTPTTLDNAHSLTGLGCSSPSRCTAVDSAGGQVTFDPTAPGTPSLVTIDSGQVLRGVACPSASQCTTVDQSGRVVTFDPTAASASAPTPIDSGHALTAVACPSVSQCTAVDVSGQQVTFDPTVSTGPPPTTIDATHALLALACPSVSRCTAVDNAGRIVSFDPGAPTPITIDSGSVLVGVACASMTQCTAVDIAGGEVTFDPTAPGTPPRTTIDTIGPVDLGPGAKATAISAGGAHTCAILDDGTVRCWGYGSDGELGYGNRDAVGDDETPGSSGPVNLGLGRTALAISAGQNHTCAILDDGSVRCWGLGASGRLGYGNTSNVGDYQTPDSAGAVDLGAGRAAVAISAGGSHTCARLDDGHVRCWGFGANGRLGYCSESNVGDTPTSTPDLFGPVNLVPGDGGVLCPLAVSVSPPAQTAPVTGVPVERSPPTLAGETVQGQALSERHGSWSPRPTGYGYQWQRCGRAGASCVAIAGATGQSYTLSASDIAHTVRVRETASNAAGAGAPASSAPSGLVMVSDAVRARGLRRCLAAVSRQAQREENRARRGPARQRAQAKLKAKRYSTNGRRGCLRRYGRTPGPVGAPRARTRGSTRIEIDFTAAGTDANHPPPARGYLIKQSLTPIHRQRDFTHAQALCHGNCRFTVTQLDAKITLTITNLKPRTTYYYAIAALDNVTSRTGPRSPTLKGRTR